MAVPASTAIFHSQDQLFYFCNEIKGCAVTTWLIQLEANRSPKRRVIFADWERMQFLSRRRLILTQASIAT